MQNIVIIPARGRSKGIKRKNLKYVWGAPLVISAAMQAKSAKNVNDVYVSTEDEEIKKVCTDYNVKYIERPKQLALDESSTDAVIDHAIDYLKSINLHVGVLGLLQCTAPFVTSRDIEEVINAVLCDNADSSFAACKWHGFLWCKNKRGFVDGINHDGTNRKRRQDMDLNYLEAGSIYALKPEVFKKQKTRFCGKTKIVEIERSRVLEIDEIEDLLIARAMLPLLANKIISSPPLEKIRGIALDFDGVLTDNKVYTDENGKEHVVCSKSDSIVVEEFQRLKIEIVIISTEHNSVVLKRAEKIGIQALTGVKNKSTVFRKWMKEKGLDPNEVIYVGNDLNDIECFHMAGLAVAPSDAETSAKKHAQYILQRKGGDGVLREIYDLIYIVNSEYTKSR